MKHACYSDIPRASFDAAITLNQETLGLPKNTKLEFRNEYFYHSSFNGQVYKDENKKLREVHHAVPSSWDRSTNNLMMARVLKDDNGSIFYAGRPDNKSRAITQAEDIFRTELALGENGKGIKKLKNGSYELTYVVNSLTNGGTLQNPGLLNERKSLLEEIKALHELKDLEIEVDGKKVTLNPIHTHHMVSFWTRFSGVVDDKTSGLAIEKKINNTGYNSLIQLGQKKSDELRGDPEKANLIKAVISNLKNPDLPVQERLMLADLLTHLCDLPIVHHCKSVVDRTSIGAGISTINHYIAHGKIPLDQIPKDNSGNFAPHLLCGNEDYKNLFLSTLNIQHQVSKDARMAITPDGKLEGRSKLGLNYHKDTFGTVPAALALMPQEAITKTWMANRTLKTITLAIGLLSIGIATITGVYYLGLMLTMTCYLAGKGQFNSEFYKGLAWLPLQVMWRWQNVFKIDASVNFDFNSTAVNGDERALLVGAKTPLMDAQKNTENDPRYEIFPEYLITKKMLT
jgi:hypothetical protein